MGVPNLTSFLAEKHKEVWQAQQVSTWVVDGRAFLYEVYDRVCKAHGDFSLARFDERVVDLLNNMHEDGMVATFVFDGAAPPEKIETHRRRGVKKTATVQKWFNGDPLGDDTLPQPVFLEMNLKRVLSTFKGKGVDFTTADFEADAPLVAVAHAKKAHIASNDSDHMLMLLPCGFVHVRDFVGRDQGIKTFKVLTSDAVQRVFNLPHTSWPRLASLVGNDYIDKDRLALFHERRLGVARENRWRVIEAVADFLHTNPSDWNKHETLSEIGREEWKFSVESYDYHNKHREVDQDAMTKCKRCTNTSCSRCACPTWRVRAARSSPDFPRQLLGMVTDGVHLCPPLLEALGNVQNPSASAWYQSRPLRACVAHVLGRELFVDWVFSWSEAAGVDYSGESVSIAKKDLPAVDLPLLSYLAQPADSQRCVTYFERATMQSEGRLEQLDSMRGFSGRLVQTASALFWARTFHQHWGRALRWPELAALVLSLVLPKANRAEIAADCGTQAPDRELAKGFAAYEACLYSAIQLHSTLGSPLGEHGELDFEYLCEARFFFVKAGSSFAVSPAEFDETVVKNFDVLLKWWLRAVSGKMEVPLGGAEFSMDGSWRFQLGESSPPLPASSGASSAGAGLEQKEKEKRKLEKALQGIGKLEARGVQALTPEEQDKVSLKAEKELQLAEIERQLRLLRADADAAPGPDKSLRHLKQWRVAIK